MHLVHGGNSFNDDVTFVQDHVLDQGVHDLMNLVHEFSVSMVMLHSPQIMYLTRDIKTSCTLLGTVAIYQRPVVAGGGFFLLLDLGPGAAACGMGIEINTGNSC